MTGKPFYKTRTITSERLVSPLAGRRDLNDAAIAFKKAVLESITRPTLNAGLSVKALDSATGKETYQDTDGKKRTNKGGTPGMVERLNGYNYLPGQKWEEGKILNLFPSVKLRKTAVKKPNFGWVDEPRSVSADEYARVLAAKPKLRIRKYKVNKKTDEIIEESEQTLDPFSLNGEKTANSSGYGEKRLPGQTIGQRGRSLIARAASAFGIIVDENGKFRCPPGTPAANQFTDSAGTNCFGISASEIFDFAKRMASGIDVSKETGVKNTTKKLFEFISWLDNGAIPGIGRTVWRDENGKRIKNIKKWREASLNDRNSRVFVDGMIRAQDKLAQQDINVASLMDSLGVIRTDEKRKTNDDVFEVFQKLRDSGAWTIDTSSRLSAEDIDKIVKARLAHVPGFSDLTPERQKSLIAADTERWYTTERALLESALDSFIADPEHMRTIAKINFQVKSPDDPRMDEASTGGYTSPDSKRVMSIIYVDIPEIMNNQEALIPSLAPGERMRIDFVGGKTDSERATALTDFLVTVDGHSKQLAAMVEERAFARHIMKHEIAHTIQMQAFNREAERQIRTNGFITVLNDKGEPVKVENIRDLTSGMVMDLMSKAGDGIDLESLKNALSRTDVVGFLAGEYPKMYFNDKYGAEHWALEAAAELWALRDLGLIYGDDIDAALEWMDDVSDGRYIDIRRRSDAEGLREIEARYYENLGPDPELSGNSVAEVRKRLEIEHKSRLSQIQNWSNDTSTTSDDFVDSLAELQYRKESLNDSYDNLEASGESKDSPQFKEINRKIKETNDYISLIEKNWAERFSSPDSEKRKKDMKSMKESVRQKMFAEGKLRPDEMAARTRQQDINDLEARANRMTVDEFVQKLADIETSLKEPGISEGMKSELLEDKKMIRAIYKSRFSDAGDPKDWSKKKKELDKGVDEILNPPTPQVLAKRRLDIAHEKEMSNIEGWTTSNSITNEKFIESLSGLQYQKEAYNDAFDDMEKNGVSKDSPDFKDLNRKIKENNEKISLIEKRWAERFSSEDRDRRSRDMRALRKSVREKMFSEGTLRPKEMAAKARQEEIKNLRQQTNDMNPEEVVQKLADIEVSLKEPGLSSEAKSVLLEDKKIIRDIYKSKLEGSEDAKVWSKQRRELDTRIDEIVNPPRQQAMKKSKKVKTDKAGASYAKKIQQDEYYAMSEEQARAVERLGDPATTDVGNLLDPDSNVAAVKSINRSYRRAQRSAGNLSPESDTASLEDQIQKVLIPAMEAIDESSIPDDLEIEAEIYFGVTESGFKDISENFDNQGFVSGRIITDESPHKPGEVRDPDGDVVTRAGKEKTRVIVQVSKGDKGLFRTNETELGQEGALILPPGKMKVVDVKPDGTVVVRVQEQDNVVDVLDRLSASIGEEGSGVSRHAKGTKKKIDRVANKYVAQRRENGLSSTPSRPKRDVEIEDKNVEVKREVISAGGSFGEPPSEDYVSESGMTSVGSASDPTAGREVLGVPQTREERKVLRATRANMTFEDTKRVMAGESPRDVMNDMSRESLDPAVADVVARKSIEAILKDVEDAAVEFHAGIDKRPRIRMTESQLTKFADDGEFLPTETDDIILESGAIGRRLERRLNPITRRESPKLSSGARSGSSRKQRVAGIAGSRATGRVLDAVLKRSGADEDTRERVKYGVNMAGALAAGGPAGFATALAVDVARRAGREIAERGLEEAVERGRITQNQMDVAMSAVDRVAPNGLPDPVVDKLADAWTIASDFIDERVVTDENRQRLDEFGNIIRAERGELFENAGQVIGSAREKIGKRFGRGKSKPSETDPFGDFDATPTTPSTSISNEYDDPFAGFDENDYKPVKTEFDDFDGVFSSGRRAGRSSDVFRDEYNSRIGISKSTPNSAKPVSGYVVHRSHNEEKKRRVAASGKGNIGSDAIFEVGDNDIVGDGLTALGEIEVILKPEVSNRTAYGRGEALQSAHRPVAMNSNDPDDIADAIMNADGISSKKQNTEAMLHLLGAKMDKNFSSVNASMDENGRMAPVGAVDSSTRGHEPFEAQILGGFKKSEVEGIHYPYTKVAKVAESEDISDVVNDRSLASKLEKLGFTPEEVAYFYSISGGKPLNTVSMVKLKEYRAAKKIKEKYEGMGIGYVKFAHPQGMNIENPRSYDKTASPTTRVDEILKRNIDAEVEAELKKTLDSIRKSGQLDLMVD